MNRDEPGLMTTMKSMGEMAERQRTVPQKMDEVYSLLNSLDTAIKNLGDKIQPALMPVYPTPTDESKMSSDRPEMCTIAGTLDDHASKLRIMLRMVEELDGRVDI